MIDRSHLLPIKLQADLLTISWSSRYYQSEPANEADLQLMRHLDELHLKYLLAGARTLRDILAQEGIRVGRCNVGRLMKRMGIHALYRQPNTSKKYPTHPVFEYLLRDRAIERANHAWSLDISYIPISRSRVYLVAALNWHSWQELAYWVTITMEADFCVETLNEAVTRYGASEIVNTYQGSQFSSVEFVEAGRACRAQQSMEGRACWRGKVFVARLRRSVKYEEAYLKAYDSVGAACTGLAKYFELYNAWHAHQGHGRCTPDTVYFDTLSTVQESARPWMEPGLPTALDGRSSKATPARRRRQHRISAIPLAVEPLVSPQDSVRTSCATSLQGYACALARRFVWPTHRLSASCTQQMAFTH
jgi:putative transposase